MEGILKNTGSYDEQEAQDYDNTSVDQFRQQVLKNTKLNAQLTSQIKTRGMSSGSTQFKMKVPKDTLSLKRGLQQQQHEDGLQWNQSNLDSNEVAKREFQDIYIDEPKTPYQGAIDPNGEYYRADDEECLEDLSLGEPQFNDSQFKQKIQINTESLRPKHVEDSDKRHECFEEMRKKHYNVGKLFKNRHINDQEVDD